VFGRWSESVNCNSMAHPIVDIHLDRSTPNLEVNNLKIFEYALLLYAPYCRAELVDFVNFYGYFFRVANYFHNHHHSQRGIRESSKGQIITRSAFLQLASLPSFLLALLASCLSL
jgi:hypothetical protein